MISSNNSQTAAIVVGYFPDLDVISNLLRSISIQVEHLILIDNGGTKEAYDLARRDGVQVEYIAMEGNQGLGCALNAGFERAANCGAHYVATFDQDSAPSVDLIARLRDSLDSLELKGANCAAVGPVFFDRREAKKVYFPFYFERNGKILSMNSVSTNEAYVETDTLITSGMMVKIKSRFR